MTCTMKLDTVKWYNYDTIIIMRTHKKLGNREGMNIEHCGANRMRIVAKVCTYTDIPRDYRSPTTKDVKCQRPKPCWVLSGFPLGVQVVLHCSES